MMPGSDKSKNGRKQNKGPPFAFRIRIYSYPSQPILVLQSLVLMVSQHYILGLMRAGVGYWNFLSSPDAGSCVQSSCAGTKIEHTHPDT
jgi:hypothetical protein